MGGKRGLRCLAFPEGFSLRMKEVSREFRRELSLPFLIKIFFDLGYLHHRRGVNRRDFGVWRHR